MPAPSADLDDIWTSAVLLRGQVADAELSALTVKTIEAVEPLDAQFGVEPKKTAPDALQEVLFGQREPTDAEIASAGGDPANVPRLRTYAILDAAKVQGLPEMLEVSELEHRCLFKGDAQEELGDVAPWIVRLEDGNDFTRCLFTRGEAPWLMWDKAPGVYLRSRATLDELWRHFRKFSRVQDENGRWFHFRFYDPACFAVSGSLLHAIDRSIRRSLSHPAMFVIVGPNAKRIRSGSVENDQI